MVFSSAFIVFGSAFKAAVAHEAECVIYQSKGQWFDPYLVSLKTEPRFTSASLHPLASTINRLTFELRKYLSCSESLGIHDTCFRCNLNWLQVLSHVSCSDEEVKDVSKKSISVNKVSQC